MNIDELCEVIRQRRKRTGWEWTRISKLFATDMLLLREQNTSCCPLTAGCLESCGVCLDPCQWETAAQRLDIDLADADIVKVAADDECMTEDEQAIRAKLEAACLGPLE